MKYIIETKDDDFEIDLPDNAQVSIDSDNYVREGYVRVSGSIRVCVPVPGQEDKEFKDTTCIAYYENVEAFRRLDDTSRTNERVA